jgi:hypothetical protein
MRTYSLRAKSRREAQYLQKRLGGSCAKIAAGTLVFSCCIVSTSDSDIWNWLIHFGVSNQEDLPHGLRSQNFFRRYAFHDRSRSRRRFESWLGCLAAAPSVAPSL